MAEAIQAEHLAYAYPGAEGGPGISVFRDLNLKIEEGTFVAVLGRNGCGKSTLAKHCNAIALPEGGTVTVFGMDTQDEGNLIPIRRTVGMVFQNPDNQIVANVVEEDVAFAPENLGVEIVTGFTGSPIWHMLYSFPPVPKKTIDDGFDFLAEMWHPILDVFEDHGVKFALEVHPTEIAFDIVTAKRTLETLDYREEFGFNFDPSHLFWQMMDPVRFIKEFPDRIFHVHIKDAALTLDGRSGILSSHLDFGQPGRGWDFRSPGHGQVNFEEIIRELNRIEYDGPLSVEWEDSGMDREYGAADAAKFVRKLDFPSSTIKFDAQMKNNR